MIRRGMQTAARTVRVVECVLFAALLGMVLAGCSGGDEERAAATGGRGDAAAVADATDGALEDTSDVAEAPSSGDAERIDDGRLVVAAVMPTARDDRGFSQSMVDALNRLAATGSIDEVIVRDNVVLDEDADVILREFATGDIDLIIGHGPQYGGLIAQLATEHPDLSFAWGYGDQTFGLPNLSAYTADATEGGYVLGQVAAHLVGQGSAALIGPQQVGDDRAYIEGFFLGIAVTGLEMDISQRYIESYVDIDVAAEKAQEYVVNEFDVLGSTSPISAGVIGVAQEAGLPYFGNQVDNADLAPDTVVASQVYRWEAVLDPLIGSISSGTPNFGEVLELNLANGGLTIDYNPAFELPPEVRAVGDAAQADAAAGGLDLIIGE